MNKKIKAGIYTVLVLLSLTLLIYAIATYPHIVLSILLIIALGGFIYAVYGLIYMYLDDKEEDPMIF